MESTGAGPLPCGREMDPRPRGPDGQGVALSLGSVGTLPMGLPGFSFVWEGGGVGVVLSASLKCFSFIFPFLERGSRGRHGHGGCWDEVNFTSHANPPSHMVI